MAHIKTSDNEQSVCTEFEEFDIHRHGDDTGPTDYCTACYAAEPEWEIVSHEEFDAKFPR